MKHTMNYGIFATITPREYRREIASAWAAERKVMFSARREGNYEMSYSSRMRLRALERQWNLARAYS